MPKLSQMLSPLKNCKTKGKNGESDQSAQHHASELEKMDLDTPLSIQIPSEPMDQGFVSCDQQNNSGQQMWSQTYNQQPLLLSKSPEQDELTKLNMTLGNQYKYHVHDEEPGSRSFYSNMLSNDPRMGYDQCSFTAARVVPYKDAYYRSAYGEPKTERTAVRHKIDDDDMGPAAKRHCGENEGSGVGDGDQMEGLQQHGGFVPASNTNCSATEKQ